MGGLRVSRCRCGWCLVGVVPPGWSYVSFESHPSHHSNFFAYLWVVIGFFLIMLSVWILRCFFRFIYISWPSCGCVFFICAFDGMPSSCSEGAWICDLSFGTNMYPFWSVWIPLLVRIGSWRGVYQVCPSVWRVFHRQTYDPPPPSLYVILFLS